LSAKNCHSSLENSLSLNHTAASGRLQILVDLGGILAWWELKELVYGCLGKASIRFCSSCAFGYVSSALLVL